MHMMANAIGVRATRRDDLILLQYPKDTQDKESCWLIGNYGENIDSIVVGKDKVLKVDQQRGILRGRLNEMVTGAVVRPQIFNI